MWSRESHVLVADCHVSCTPQVGEMADILKQWNIPVTDLNLWAGQPYKDYTSMAPRPLQPAEVTAYHGHKVLFDRKHAEDDDPAAHRWGKLMSAKVKSGMPTVSVDPEHEEKVMPIADVFRLPTAAERAKEVTATLPRAALAHTITTATHAHVLARRRYAQAEKAAEEARKKREFEVREGRLKAAAAAQQEAEVAAATAAARAAAEAEEARQRRERQDAPKSANDQAEDDGAKPADAEDAIEIQGWLSKKSRGGFSNWNKRYFILAGSSLYYAKSGPPELAQLQLFTKLPDGTVVRDVIKDNKFQIVLNDEFHSLFLFQASDIGARVYVSRAHVFVCSSDV